MKPSRRKIKSIIEVTTKQGVEHTMGFSDMGRGLKAAIRLQYMMKNADPDQAMSFTKSYELLTEDGVELVDVPTLTVRAGEISSVEFTDMESWQKETGGF